MTTDPGTTVDPGTAMPADSTTSPDGSFRYHIERLKGSLVLIEVEATADRLHAAVDRAFERHNRQAKIPGFRPGKAPRAIYERHYGTDHLWEDAAGDVMDETYREIVQAERLDPLDRPEVDLTRLQPDHELRYRATVAVRPEVHLGDYSAHGVKVEPAAPTDEDVERVIAGMREHHAELKPVDRAARADDVVTVDIDARVDGRDLTMARNGHLELGREYSIPGLAAGLVGMLTGQDRTLELTFPDDTDEDLRGKKGTFKVHVSAVAEKVLPPLDETFAGTVGVADLLALRKAVRDELAHGAFHEARDGAADRAIAHALETSTVEVAEVLIQDELDHMIAELKARAAERNIPWERFLLQAKKTEGEIREEWRSAAERRAKSLLVLDAIAEREGVAVSSTELAQEVALSPLAQRDPQALRSPQVLAALARSMRNRKVVDKLIGLDTPDAERDLMRQMGADFAPHAETAGQAAEGSDVSGPAEETRPSGIIVPERSGGTAEGREAIRKMLEEKAP